MINAIKHNTGIHKFLFEGIRGSGKKEAAKHVARLVEGMLFYVDCEHLIDRDSGEASQNIVAVFNEINSLARGQKVLLYFDQIDEVILGQRKTGDGRGDAKATSTLMRELDRLTDLNKEIVIIASSHSLEPCSQALMRRFDGLVSFNRYSQEDLIEIAEFNFATLVEGLQDAPSDKRLFKKILMHAPNVPYPGPMKKMIKTALAFSDTGDESEYLRRLYNDLIGHLERFDMGELYAKGFTVREIAKLVGSTKSTVARGLKKSVETTDGSSGSWR